MSAGWVGIGKLLEDGFRLHSSVIDGIALAITREKKVVTLFHN